MWCISHFVSKWFYGSYQLSQHTARLIHCGEIHHLSVKTIHFPFFTLELHILDSDSSPQHCWVLFINTHIQPMFYANKWTETILCENVVEFILTHWSVSLIFVIFHFINKHPELLFLWIKWMCVSSAMSMPNLLKTIVQAWPLFRRWHNTTLWFSTFVTILLPIWKMQSLLLLSPTHRSPGHDG